ncbi:2-C-methyl-D-erythritol 4-phosphate cytidylyltransferase, partial [Salmonella enterica]|uniref:2-C-methyl-D-erythritol 4-phosphate cytidylyltransferase n=1 Tax=Salmonella enterica TaxID=28901 RepID=UPI00398C458A
LFPASFFTGGVGVGRAEGAPITDEGSGLEYCGFHPALVEGRADNIKVTRPEELALAEFYLTRTIHQEKA